MNKTITVIASALMTIASTATFADEVQVVIEPGSSPACAKVQNVGCYAFWIFDRRMKVTEAFPGGDAHARAVLHANGYENADESTYLEPGRYILVDDQSP